MELADKFEKGMHISLLLVADEGELLDQDDVLLLTSSDPAASALLTSSQDEQDEAVESEDVSECALHACPAYDKLLEVISHATDRLDLPWKRE